MGKSLVTKGKGEVAGVGDELPENAPRRRKLLFCLGSAPILAGAVGALTNAQAPGLALWLGCSLMAIVPMAMVFVAGYIATAVCDALFSVGDQVVWPALRWLGRNLAESFQDGRRISPFLRDEDPIEESRAIQTFIPDEQWVPSVGALVAVHVALFSWALAIVAEMDAALAYLGTQVLMLWTLVACMVALLALRTAAGRYRTVIGLVWIAQESLSWAARLGRRGYYLTQPDLKLEAGVAADEVTCPYCAAPLGESPRVACEACQTPHHADCWEAFGRCTMYACTGQVGRRMG